MGYKPKTWQTGDYIMPEDLNHIEEGIAGLETEMAGHGAVVQLAAEVDAQKLEIEELQEMRGDVEDLTDRMRNIADTKANATDLDAVVTALDQTDGNIRDQKEHILTKAETAGMETVIIGLDQAERDIAGLQKEVALTNNQLTAAYEGIDANILHLQEVDLALQHKVDHDGLMMAVVNEIGSKADQSETDEKIAVKAMRTPVEVALVQIDAVESDLAKTNRDIISVQGSIADVRQIAAGRVPKPGTSPEGTAGQVLSTNGDGTTTWVDQVAPSGEQIGEAVAEWLDQHPEATTTVEDGSITEEKLSPEVREAIGDNALALDSGIMAAMESEIRYAHEVKDFDKEVTWKSRIFDKYQDKLIQYTSYFTGYDGIGFLFFTDPHNLSPQAFGKDEPTMLREYRFIKAIYDSTPAQYVLCGGDMMNGAGYTYEHGLFVSSRAINMCKSNIGERCYVAVGNHDVEWWGADGLSLTEERRARIWYDRDYGYYTVDSDQCTCVVFDTGKFSNTKKAYNGTQLAWFASLLAANTKPHLYGMLHYVSRPSDGGPDWLGDGITRLADAFNRRTSVTYDSVTYDFSHTTGTFHFMLAGHYHFDDYWVVNNIPVIYTTAFVLHGAIDCCYADFDAAKLHMVRIELDDQFDGAGNSRNLDIVANQGGTL